MIVLPDMVLAVCAANAAGVRQKGESDAIALSYRQYLGIIPVGVDRRWPMIGQLILKCHRPFPSLAHSWLAALITKEHLTGWASAHEVDRSQVDLPSTSAAKGCRVWLRSGYLMIAPIVKASLRFDRGEVVYVFDELATCQMTAMRNA